MSTDRRCHTNSKITITTWDRRSSAYRILCRQLEATPAEIEAKSGKKRESLDLFQSVEKDARGTAGEHAFR
jgi:hypothetical protein